MRTIVDDVSCEVRPGQLMAILGPSGSGKTSFLDAVALRYEDDADVRAAISRCVLLLAAR
jgi:ABC-type multidrug transport system ATPase subunit